MKRTWLLACAAPFGAPCGIKENTGAILATIKRAQEQGARLLVLPRLCITSGSCGDLYCDETLLAASCAALDMIALASGDMLTCVGLPMKIDNCVYDICAFVRSGKVEGLVPFIDAPPPFSSGRNLQGDNKGTPDVGFTFRLGKKKVVLYQGRDSLEGDIYCYPALLSLHAGSGRERLTDIAALSEKLDAVILFSNAGAAESTTDRVYGGGCAAAKKGSILDYVPPFESDSYLLVAGDTRGADLMRTDEESDPRFPYVLPPRATWLRGCIEIPAHALATRIKRINAKTAIVGVSGGLDSAMTLLIVKNALELCDLNSDALIAVSMPGPGSGEKTQRSARKLCDALGVTMTEIPITGAVMRHLEDIGHSVDNYDTAYQNAQARERTQILMDLANMHRGIMAGTGDMSELALGFTTFGGDHLSMYGVNAGLPKTAIRLVLQDIADRTQRILLKEALTDILRTPISPELLPGGAQAQQTEDILGPYELTDFYLWHYLNDHAAPAKLLSLAQDAFKDAYTAQELLTHMREFFKRFFASQFKRSCMPDGPQVLPVSLSPRGGLIMPSDADGGIWLDAVDDLLAKENNHA